MDRNAAQEFVLGHEPLLDLDALVVDLTGAMDVWLLYRITVGAQDPRKSNELVVDVGAVADHLTRHIRAARKTSIVAKWFPTERFVTELDVWEWIADVLAQAGAERLARQYGLGEKLDDRYGGELTVWWRWLVRGKRGF